MPVYIIADAWDGKFISSAINEFLAMVTGHASETIRFNHNNKQKSINAAAAAHLVVYIGNNAKLDKTLSGFNGLTKLDIKDYAVRANNPPKTAIVLACQSAPYFNSILLAHTNFPLLLTTGNMAPEAYTLDKAIEAWLENATAQQIRASSADTYAQYQKISKATALRLFRSEF
ncbi:hypothetical protein [Kaarinaea lacus]